MSTLVQTLKLHPTQAAFRSSTAILRGFVGGRGAGKSWVGAYDLLRRAQPNRLYMVLAPTYTELQDSSWRTLLSVARELRFLRRDNKSDLWLLLGNGAEILGRSADHPERLRGPNLSGLWIDEAAQVHEEAYQIGLGCLREAGQQGWLSCTFTPKGKTHWTYRVFMSDDPNSRLFSCPTRDNPFLPRQFEGLLRGQYTSTMAAQELEGEFINFEGALFQLDWLGNIAEHVPTGERQKVRYWDKAGTEGGGAYTAGVLMSRLGSRFFVEDVIRGQWSSHKRNEIMLATAQRDGKETHIWVEQEPGSGGKESAELTLRMLAGWIVHAERVTGDKATRAQPFAAQCEAGNVVLLRRSWLPAYVDELTAFPEGPYADQVDASSGAFNKLASKASGTISVPPKDRRDMMSRAPGGVFSH